MLRSYALCAGSKPVPDELRLVLYALHQQATVGPCTEAKPWSWNVVESAKWESWNQLGNMSSVEAMRLYVRMVEDAQVTGQAAHIYSTQPGWASQCRGGLPLQIKGCRCSYL